MFSVGGCRLLILACISYFSFVQIGCKRVAIPCDSGEAILFSEIGRTILRDSVCAICPDGSQYRQLMRPDSGQSFLFAQGNSLNWPLVVTVHSRLSNNTTEDHLYLADMRNGILHPIPKLTGQQAVAALSPDGSKVAYESQVDVKSFPRLAVTDVKSGETTLVPFKEGELYQRPNWSPDGKELMFVSLHRGQESAPILTSLMRVPFPIGDSVALFGPEDLISSSAYAHDGKRFAMWSVYGLEIVERSTLRRIVILPTSSLRGHKPGSAGLIWGRHSHTLAFTLVNAQTSASELWTVHEDGRGARMIFSSKDGTLYVGSFVEE